MTDAEAWEIAYNALQQGKRDSILPEVWQAALRHERRILTGRARLQDGDPDAINAILA